MRRGFEGGHVKAVVAVVLLAIVVALLIALPVMWLWNALCPDLFGLPHIGFFQALGLYMLGNLLFGGNTGVKES